MAQKSSKIFSFIGENIKKIRMAKNISQADFAALFNLARPSIGAYEEGRSEPKIETVIAIAQHFRISIDVLLTRELTMNDIFSIGLLNEKLNKAHQLPKSKAKMTEPIVLVRIKEFVDYIVNHKNNDFLNELSHISVPKGDAKTFRAFEMNGSEMEYHQQGLHHGDILVGKRVEKIESLKKCIIVAVTQEVITSRRVESQTEKSLMLSSDDPNYPLIEIPKENLIEVWKVVAHYSTYLNPPTFLAERVLRLEKEVQKLKKT